MAARRIGTIPLLLLLGVAACEGTIATPVVGCTPGSPRACRCADGSAGTQHCNDVGQAYDACTECTGVDPCPGGQCPDPATSLSWQQTPQPLVLKWAEARRYCLELVLGGHDDWRLPTLDELRSIVRACQGTVTKGSCPVGASCLTPDCRNLQSCEGCSWNGGPGENGCYWLPELLGTCYGFWSDSELNDSGSAQAWYLAYDSARIAYEPKVFEYYVRCVRSY